ncbi:histidine phosphotransferase family protein [Albimonas sp. CAU 1670]|uniref:histidine phosphotransferase family protein n=1 Tax=Albimonas sp. CAU 1670 TaxID=3032599 RepID=UPI0023D9918D|nr:histidine phosphotransferase family protein [Albimonas sp. CAU 1670]MDF2232109.1 histidine phosphotransferase family protein [Albimonas sp. CAU 1670]
MTDPWSTDPWASPSQGEPTVARPAAAPEGATPGAATLGGLGADDYAALMCSRICHDLISPVGAIGNGVELLREVERGSDGTELQLIERSAEMASAYLQFLRIAFGAAPPGDLLGLPAAQRTARGWFEFQRPDLDWAMEGTEITRAAARLAFNFLQIAVSALPRGGLVRIASSAEAGGLRLSMTAEGPTAAPAPGAADWLAGRAAEAPPAPREVHYIAAAAHARACGARIDFASQDGGLSLSATLPPGV